ncbi:hypothetical protein JXA84_06045 [candidate division WOR-3 bacterium]|nr:hypothetical protein [candidate division WOR-3 bacterium]
MFSKIIVTIFEKKLSQKTIKWLIGFSKLNSAETYVFSVIEKNLIENIIQQNGRKREVIQEEQVRKRWFEAYEIEEKFKSQGLFINLSVAEIDTDEDLIALISKTKADLLVLCEPEETEIKKTLRLFSCLGIPILVFQ